MALLCAYYIPYAFISPSGYDYHDDEMDKQILQKSQLMFPQQFQLVLADQFHATECKVM